jgi:hypothetical protein
MSYKLEEEMNMLLIRQLTILLTLCDLYQTTIFIILPGTIITFFGLDPLS